METPKHIKDSYKPCNGGCKDKAKAKQPVPPAKIKQPVPPAKIEKKDLPWDLRLWLLIRMIVMVVSWKRTFLWLWGLPRRLALKPVGFYPKLRSFLTTVCSGSISQAEYRERQKVCVGCEFRDGEYCGACKCPKWFFSKLIRKNKKKKHLCPHKLHAGEYPIYHDLLSGMIRSGCKGCQSRNQTPKS